jgi:hypothetical protein
MHTSAAATSGYGMLARQTPERVIGHCVYCSSTERLSREHIIPKNLGGTRGLQKASCELHRRVTSEIETKCERQYFYNIRRHLRFVPMKRKRIRVKISYPDRAETEGMPIEEHPGTFCVYAFTPPLILFGWPRQNGRPGVIPVMCFPYPYPDCVKRSKKHSHKPLVLHEHLDPMLYARMLAKIAYCHTIDQIGLSFAPFVLPLINGDEPADASYLVGGCAEEFPQAGGTVPPPGNTLHEIGFVPPPEPCPGATPAMIVVRIRLFSKYGAPAHYVVVGERSSIM